MRAIALMTTHRRMMMKGILLTVIIDCFYYCCCFYYCYCFYLCYCFYYLPYYCRW